MQNKAVLYGVGVLVIIVIAASVLLMMGKTASAPTTTAPQTQTQSPQTQNTSLKNLLSMAGSNKCTFTSSTQNSQSQGTVYVSQGVMRGDFTSVSSGKTMESHMIVKDGTSYVWSDVMPQGMKMSFEKMSAQSDANPQSTVNPNAQVDYACSAWVADAAMFALPANVTFQDLSAMVPAGAPTSVGASAGGSAGMSVQGSAAQCGACNQIPDAAARAQCKVALSCK